MTDGLSCVPVGQWVARVGGCRAKVSNSLTIVLLYIFCACCLPPLPDRKFIPAGICHYSVIVNELNFSTRVPVTIIVIALQGNNVLVCLAFDNLYAILHAAAKCSYYIKENNYEKKIFSMRGHIDPYGLWIVGFKSFLDGYFYCGGQSKLFRYQ